VRCRNSWAQKRSLYYQHNDKLTVAYLRATNYQWACFAQSGFGFQQQFLFLKKFQIQNIGISFLALGVDMQ